MQQPLIAVVMLASVVATGCTQGFLLEEGKTTESRLTRAKFAFGEGQTEIAVGFAPTSLIPKTTPPRTEAPTATPTEAPVAAKTPSSPGRPAATAGPQSVPTGPAEPRVTSVVIAPKEGFDPTIVAGNPMAFSIAIPNAGVDPGLETFDESRDPSLLFGELGKQFTPEIWSGTGLESFLSRFSVRQPESAALTERQRPVQLGQFVFVHATAADAEAFYGFLSNEMVGGLASAWEQSLQRTYPNLEARTTALGNVPPISDQVTFVILSLDPRVPEDSPITGPTVPIVYYVVVRQARVNAVLEIVYLLEQDPNDVLLIGEVLASRVPTDLAIGASP